MVMIKEYGVLVLQLLLTIRMVRALCSVEDTCRKYCYLRDMCNSRFGNASDHNDTFESFVGVLDIPCPPPGQLHHVCNKSLSTDQTTCDERVLIIDRCLQRFPGIYNDSLWDTCLMDDYSCDAIVNYLATKGYIDSDEIDTTVSVLVTSSVSVTSESVTTHYSNITSHELDISSPVVTISSPVETTSKHLTSSETTRKEVVTDSKENQSITTTAMKDSLIAPPDSDMFPRPLSVIYPLIGSFVILCEIAILCAWFCYKKRKQKAAAQDSLVPQDEVIEPETASPTKALRNNFDEDYVKTEDEKIYRSYINLKYIDESADSTPQKGSLRT